MGTDLQFLCPWRTSKLLWSIGLIFTSILIVQYFELPCGNAASCLFPSFKSSLPYSGQNYEGRIINPSNNSVSEEHGPAINLHNITNEDGNSIDKTLFEDSSRKSMVNATERKSSLEKAREFEHGPTEHVAADIIKSVSENFGGGNMVETNKNLSVISNHVSNTTENDKVVILDRKNETFRHSRCNSGLLDRNSPVHEETPKREGATALSIATMNNILLRSHALSVSNSAEEQCYSASDQELLHARSSIENAPIFKNTPALNAPIYWNLSRFQRSYELMEQTLKVYIYKEGKRPVFHQPNLKGIYASEGWFMKLMEANKQFITTNPKKAHLFYLPFSSQMLEQTIYVPHSHSFDRLKQYLENYLNIIKTKYPFWNRTSGADHFLVACHDWAPEETRRLMARCIRALCNADIKESFQLGKDVSLPETFVQNVKFSPKEFRGNRPSKRQFLAFFAGNMHGYVRPILLKYWENKDPEMKIFGRLKKASYINHMKSSKYCICARGYEVNSPRLVESIMYGCVPVIISDNFVPPFLEVLNWEKIAVFVLEKDIPNLKNILLSISERRYLVMQRRVKMVRQHFLWHPVPEKYDIFHMILHSVWYNRVFQVT